MATELIFKGNLEGTRYLKFSKYGLIANTDRPRSTKNLKFKFSSAYGGITKHFHPQHFMHYLQVFTCLHSKFSFSEWAQLLEFFLVQILVFTFKILFVPIHPLKKKLKICLR